MRLPRSHPALALAFAAGCWRTAGPPPPLASSPQVTAPAEAPEAGGDRDGDGIRDRVDRCPDEPEDFDSFEDEDGCPDPDNDRDGILDVDDLCPNAVEDRDGVQDDDGCPEP